MLETLNLILSAILVGLILTIQFVHYPSFKYFPKEQFNSFHSFHTMAITFVVGPLMLMELSFGAYLLYFDQSLVNIINMSLIALIWLNTGLWNVPLHDKLSKSFNIEDCNRLVLSNWPRTLLWCSKLVILAYNQF